MAKEIREFEKLVEDHYPEKRGYAEAVRYYFNIIASNRAVKNSSEFKPIVIKFRETLKEFINHDSPTALLDLSEIFTEFYNKEEGELPDLFVTQGLRVAFEGISECLMRLKKLYNFDYWK